MNALYDPSSDPPHVRIQGSGPLGDVLRRMAAVADEFSTRFDPYWKDPLLEKQRAEQNGETGAAEPKADGETGAVKTEEGGNASSPANRGRGGFRGRGGDRGGRGGFRGGRGGDRGRGGFAGRGRGGYNQGGAMRNQTGGYQQSHTPY